MTKISKSYDQWLWNSYAQVYDLMAEHNPAYQNVIKQVLDTLSNLSPPPSGILFDIGAGTGNFSIAVAKRFPQLSIRHIESNDEMNQKAMEKANSARLCNWSVQALDYDTDWPNDSTDIAIMIHTLYTSKNSQRVLTKLYNTLVPSGILILCDVGRVIDTNDWALFLFRENLRRIGILRTLRLFVQGRVVARANRIIAAKQRAGEYWTHSLSELCEAITGSGFVVVESSVTYQGYSDFVIARKKSINQIQNRPRLGTL